MKHEFQRVAIVNRGEAAMRFIHAAREFNQEHGTSLRTIALFTEPDRHAMFVREADEAVCLGPAQVIDPDTQQLRAVTSTIAVLERALATARADAVWVGWGFVAEHAAFADLCHEMGIVFIGPDGDVMRRAGRQDRLETIGRAGADTGSALERRPGGNARRRLGHAERLGYPLLIKATAGGGGHGIRLVRSADQLPQAFASARAEAFKAFGDPTVFLEQQVQRRAPRRGPDHRRPLRDHVGRRRARLHHPAPPPENPRRSTLAGAFSGARSGAARGGGALESSGGLSQRRHRRIPVRTENQTASRSWR